MVSKLTIKQLYEVALAEGEGIGTAYEYYAKRLCLLPWIYHGPLPRSILVAGLPEIYGSSLDFLLIAAQLGSRVTVVDDRPQALVDLKKAFAALDRSAFPIPLHADRVLIDDLSRLSGVAKKFDLIVSSEVIQRLNGEQRAHYVNRLCELAPRIALFSPNADNESHVSRSGLSSLLLRDFRTLADHQRAAGQQLSYRSGFIDMPPFPPGITRSEEQRAEASTGTIEAFAMWGLGYYARAERLVPAAIRRRWSHIVYLLIEPLLR